MRLKDVSLVMKSSDFPDYIMIVSPYLKFIVCTEGVLVFSCILVHISFCKNNMKFLLGDKG